MTLAVPHSASITYSAPASSRARPPAASYDATQMLMNAALERLEAARYWRIGRSVTSGVDSQRLRSALLIIGELRAALDLDRGGDIAANVDQLYDYMCRRLSSVGLPNGIAALEEVSHLLHALRSAWAFLRPSG